MRCLRRRLCRCLSLMNSGDSMTGIYIHIPFCVQKCAYCDFNSYPGLWDMSYSYGKAAEREIINSPFRGGNIDTVYIGGGTPTSIDDEIIRKILDALKSGFDISGEAEITVECNPGTADLSKLLRLRRAGINRLSIGCQSADDGILKKLGRIHSFSDFADCFRLARDAGFENISVDLMFGLPGQNMKIWTDTLGKITAMSPEHISAYSLKIEEGTPFYDMRKAGKLDIPDDDLNRAMYDAAVEYLNGSGYKRYEISNFSKPGFESRHNLIYWRLDDYIGFGAGAHSFAGGKRFSNPLGIGEYISSVNSGSPPSDLAKPESVKEMMCEFMFLGLRLDEGVSKRRFKSRFGEDMTVVFRSPLDKHLRLLKTLEDSGDRIKIKPEYTYVSNIIMSDFII